MIVYGELVKAFGRNLSEWLRQFSGESSPVRPEYKQVQVEVTRLFMVLSATQYTEFTKAFFHL
jgi:hypothetical protein